MNRLYCDWNNSPENDGTYRALWRLQSSGDGSLLIDYPCPSPGETVAVGEGEDWFIGNVLDAGGLAPTHDGREYGIAFVRVDFEHRLFAPPSSAARGR